MNPKWMMVAAMMTGSIVSQAQTTPMPVLQRGYDANVTGANITETLLNASNVSPTTFGLLFKLPVDEKIFAQPLWVPNVAIPNLGTHNVLYVATMNDTVYAFDADVGGAPLWSVNLASLVGATVPVWASIGNPPFDQPGNFGILSTPVIDPSTNMMYVVGCTLENSAVTYRLHAFDITTGAEPYGPGVLITASYSGSTFAAHGASQRMSLVLADNQVVFGFSAMLQETPTTYQGWVIAYDKATLQQSGAFAPVITGYPQGGVWQAGRPPAVDSSGYVYAFTGNTSTGGWNGVTDFSETALKLDPSQGLALVDWFTPGNWQYLDLNDLDLGSSGPLLIPGTTLLAGGGKTGDLYVLDTRSLGHWTANDSQVVQSLNITSGNQILAGPVYWVGSSVTGGPLIYNWGASDVLKAFAFDGSTFATSPSMVGSYSAILPGGALALSANGNAPGSGILWANTAANKAANPPVVATLHAFNAENLSNELWNSTMNAARDGYGNYARFVPPLIANGKVYMATASNQVAVYGLLPDMLAPSSLAFGIVQASSASAPQSVTVTNISSAALPISSITITGTGSGQFAQTNTCGTSVPVGSNCAVNVVFTPTSAGSKVATLNVIGGGGAGTQSVSLGGTGVAPMPTYSASPTSLGFGSVQTNAGSGPQPVTVTNTGSVALPITSIVLTGTNRTQFSQTNTCGASVPVGSNCTVNVVFTPTSAGSKVATLNVNGGGGSGTQSISLNGTGVAPTPTYSASPTLLGFGSVQTNAASGPQPVTVTNTGSVALPITSIVLTGTNRTQFSQTNTCGASVPTGSNCTVNVVFTPTSAGSKVATLNVNGGGGAGTQSVSLNGTGVAPTPTYSVSPTSLAFGSVQTNTASGPQPVTVTNTGSVALPITSIVLAGTNRIQFSQTNSCGASVPVGSNCTVNVVFTPTATGSKVATLNVNGGGGAGTQAVSLTGTGN